MVDLKSYFHEKYKGGESFIDEVIKPIFGEDKYEDAYEEDILENNPELTTVAQNTGIAQILRLGTVNIPMNPTDVFDITVGNHVQMKRNRVAVQQLIRRIMSTYSSAFMVFHYDDDDKWDWRFSFCSKQGSNQESTDSKRYTFLLGPNQSCRTAADNFNKLASKTENIKLEDIIKAFDVEVLSDEFFEKYKEHYEKFCNYIYDNKNDETKFGKYFATCPDKEIRDYVKKLLGRLVFLQFLQKKRWLGGTSCQWNDGDQDFLQNLFKNATDEQKADFLDSVLDPLFQLALDCDRKATSHDFNTGVEGFTKCKIPYLNGGLFSSDKDIDDANSDFPAEYFESLFKFFSEYNFTIDENDPNDAEVGIDPEMLGRIFENLLEDNKDKGAFYTPKEIVQYMSRESLIEYLQTDFTDEKKKNAIRSFVITNDEVFIGGKESEIANIIDKRLKDIKICDPAIGSGAFPMGMLRQLYTCRSVLEDFNTISSADIKKEIIQNNIYGVDIEKGAVDIARLRFWLTLILDEESPEALPNLDFKIMQGNSLLESFHGIDLTDITLKQTAKLKSRKISNHKLQQEIVFMDEQEALVQIQSCILRYYDTDNHSKKRLLYSKIENGIRQYIANLTMGNTELHKLALELPLCNEQYFLWHTFFGNVFENGGFDIVIGNPPYGAKLKTEEKKYIKGSYESAKTIEGKQKGSLDTFSLFIEKGLKLSKKNGVIYMIVPLSITSSDSMSGLHNLLLDNCETIRVSSYGDRPKRIFKNAEQQVSIISFRKTGNTCKYILTTAINKRYSDESLWLLLDKLCFTNSLGHIRNGRIPKLGNQIEAKILDKLERIQTTLGDLFEEEGALIYYRKAGGRYYKLITTKPTYSSAEGAIVVDSKYQEAIAACLSTSLYYWFWLIHSDWHNMRTSELSMFPIPINKFTPTILQELKSLYSEYQQDLLANSKTMKSGLVCFYARKSKSIIDKMDRYIGKLYGLEDEEIEFIINYDIAYRNNDE